MSLVDPSGLESCGHQAVVVALGTDRRRKIDGETDRSDLVA